MALLGRRVWTTVALVILCVGADASAQGLSVNTFLDWNFLGAGARGRGMGGAYLGVSDRGDAASWNPAGLIYNDGVLMTLNYGLSSYTADMDRAPSGNALTPVSTDDLFSNVPSAAFVAPVTISEKEFVLSAFYNRAQQAYAEGSFAGVGREVGAPAEQIAPVDAQFAIRGNIDILGGAFGTAITDRLTFGGLVAVVAGDGKENQVIDLDSTRFPNAGVDHSTWYNDSDLDYSGFLWSLGAMYRTDRWSLGMVFTPGWTLTQALNYNAVRVTEDNGIIKENPVRGGVLSPLEGTARELDIPYNVGWGLSYKLQDNMILAADYQYRAFKSDDTQDNGSSGLRFQDEPPNPEAEFEDQRVGWYNLHQVRLGLEYEHETSLGVIPFRIGVRNEPYVIGDNSTVLVVYDQRLEQRETAEQPYFIPVTSYGSVGDQINPIIFTIGSGVRWSQVTLDWSMEFGSYSYNESGELRMITRCTNCSPVLDEDVKIDEWGRRKTHRFGNFDRIYDVNRFKFSMNFTGRF